MKISDIADIKERTFLQQEPIAIIGIGCRYSGDINNLDDFWKVLINKRSTLKDIPSDRVSNEFLYDSERGYRKVVTKQGGWLDHIKEFDAKFFNISPREAEKVDPHQRMMLEVTYEAFEDAGIKLEEVWGTRTGVYAGMWSSDFEHVLANSKDDIDVYSTTGSGRYAAAGRLAYYFNLQGPTFTIDTACSTSLVAIHLASQSLHLKECDMAICSAANLLLDPFISIGYSRSRLLSDYGLCKFGADQPGGYVRTEGAATVVLKRLSDAQKDGDFIYGIVPGSACNNDGHSNNHMLAPSPITQEVMIKDALNRARLEPSKIQYVEAHGTGTKAGDPVEIASISGAIDQGRSPDDIFYVGSIKTNLGHTEAASGLAGLLKVILSIQNRTIPASLYSDEALNPNIPWDELKLKIPSDAVPWPKPDQPLIAGLNSFGISGTNAHLIIQEAPERSVQNNLAARKYNILPISGANKQALQDYCRLYLPLFQKVTSDQELLNLVKNIAIRKADLQYRAAVIFKTKEDIIHALEAIIKDEEDSRVLTAYNESRKRTALVFPGQGAQWAGMGRTLYQHEPAFRASIDEFSLACEKYTDWSLKDKIFNSKELEGIELIQPALLAIEIALAEWWRSIGLDFKAVVGHSMGEVGAAYIAGAISLDAAAAIICTRSQLMKRTSGQGAMAYIALPPQEVVNQIGGDIQVVGIGVQNSLSSCVISGVPEAVDKLCDHFDRAGAFVRKVKVDVASHSHQMDPLLEDLKRAVQWIEPKSTVVEIFSSVETQSVAGESLGADYWAKNLRNTVEFATTIQNMIEEGYSHFVEVSPHPTLLQPILENAESLQIEVNTHGSIEREKDELYSLMYQVSNYFVQGGRISWKKYYDLSFDRLQLPAYPWQRVKYWVEEQKEGKRLSGGQAVSEYPFLAQFFENSLKDQLYIWETEIDLREFAYLKDHKIQETYVFPAAAYIEIIWEAVSDIFGAGKHLIQDIQLKNALPLVENQSAFLQIILSKDITDNYTVQVFSTDESGDELNWVEHATAQVYINAVNQQILSDDISKGEVDASVIKRISQEEHYEKTSAIDLPYGPAFQTVQELSLGEIYIKATIKEVDSIKSSISRYFIHPAILDGFIQVLLASVYNGSKKNTFVPTSVGEVLLHRWSKDIVSGTITVKMNAVQNNRISGHAVVYDANNDLVLEMKDFVLERLEQDVEGEDGELGDTLYEIVQVEADLPEQQEKRVVLFAADDLSEEFIQAIKPIYIVRKGQFFSNDGNDFIIDVTNFDHYTQLIDRVKGQVDTVVHTWNIDEKSVPGLEPQENTTLSVIRIIQALSKSGAEARLWLMTDAVDKFPAQSTAIGLLNVVRNEHPELSASSVQVEDGVYHKAIGIFLSDTDENSWHSKSDGFTVERLQPIVLEKVEEEAALEEDEKELVGDHAFEVVMKDPGLLSNLTIQKKRLPRLADHEVRVHVKAIGINFMNLMSALGIYPGKENGFATLGIECAGVVEEVGSEVSHLQVGDRVFGMAYHTMASHVDVNADLMRVIPNHLTFEEAATIPVVFLTAYYGLIELANLQQGERVLIHSATGGVGLAAIQLAKYVGAEIYATAGNQEKREYLRSLGIKHIYNSRSLDFADQILEDTSGEGVDVVLNSLVGSAMKKSLGLLRNFGRFVEIGKKDIYENSRIGLDVFSKGLSYFMIDFEKMIFERPQLVGGVLGELIDYFESKDLSPLPGQVFHVSQVQDAFDYMTKSKQIGKIVIQIDSEDVYVDQLSTDDFDAQATYLITGGYGGLGLTFAQHLIDKGATRLVLTGRSGKSDHPKIHEWTNQGIEIILKAADVSEREEVEGVFQETADEDKPLKGVFHLAGILDDASILNLDEDAYYRVLSPKVLGAFNLHIASQAYDLEHFVLFSSSTILFGSPGQAAYVSANHYMDALVKYRERLGLVGKAIQWGTVSDVGLAASSENRSDRLADEGIAPLSPAETTELFDLISMLDNSVVGAFRFNIQKWQDTYTSAESNHFYDILRAEIKDTSTTDEQNKKVQPREILAEIEDLELRTIALEDQLKEIVGKVVKLQAEEIHGKSTFKSLGIDSLMSIQLKNQLEKQYETALSVTAFWTHSNIRDYTKFLLEKIQLHEIGREKSAEQSVEKGSAIEKDSKPVVEEQKTAPSKPTIDEVSSEDISLDELSQLLDDELGDLLGED